MGGSGKTERERKMGNRKGIKRGMRESEKVRMGEKNGVVGGKMGEGGSASAGEKKGVGGTLSLFLSFSHIIFL